MGSLLLFLLGIFAPFGVATAVLALDEARRKRVRRAVARLTQDNRGLKLALASQGGGVRQTSVRAGTDAPPLRPAVPQAMPQALAQAVEEWGADGVVAALERLKGRLAAVAEMEVLWADPQAPGQQDAAAMLERTLWVFEPEYVVGEGQLGIDERFGAVARPSIAGGLTPHHSREGEPVLLVELKNAQVTVGADQQLRAWSNVRELIRGGAIGERDPVDVFVVGGAVDELEGNPRLEGRHRNVRITSYDYSNLVTRAKRLTFGLYDELKDSAPFLRQHRAELAAMVEEARAAGSEQAAAQEAVEPEPAPEEAEQGGHYRRRFASR